MLVAGQMFGNYRIVEKIGVGGMGSVYLAEHPAIGKQVALKVIHGELSANKEVITRFFNEARAANQIGNEHIVNIHDFGQTDDGEHFYIMEYLEGRTLAQLLAQSPTVNAGRVMHVVAQMAAGLHAAHQADIIHRDLKPDNVILVNRMGDADFVKILDFGLAKVLSAEQKLTAAGVVLGTPQYMSPEACESRQDIDHRSDIYSLGILMFQMLCGRVPFQGETMGEVLIKQVTKQPPAPRSFNPSIPPSVEQIVLRCLAKDRKARFASMAELRTAALAPEKYLATAPATTTIPPAGHAGGGARSTQFFGGGAPVNHPNMAPPTAGESLGPPPSSKKTAFLGSESSSPSLLKTLPPIGTAAEVLANMPKRGGKAQGRTQLATAQQAPGMAPQRAPQRAPAQMAPTQAPQMAPTQAPQRPAHAARTAFMEGASAGQAPAAQRASAPGPVPPKGASVKTAFMAPGQPAGMAPPAAPSAAPPPAAKPSNANAKTAFMAPAVGNAPNAPNNAPPNAPNNAPSNAPGGASTQYMAPNAQVGAPPPIADLGQQPGAHAHGQQPANNRTMAVAPPAGYKEHPPQSASPVWIGVGVVLAVGLFAVLGFAWPGFLVGSSSEASEVSDVSDDPAVLDAKPVTATVPPPSPDASPVKPAGSTADAAPAKPESALAKIELISEPSGAQVFDGRGRLLLKKTPGVISLPRSDEPVELTFRHRKAQEQTTIVVPSGDARVRLDLPKKKRSGGRRNGSGSGRSTRDDPLTPSFD